MAREPDGVRRHLQSVLSPWPWRVLHLYFQGIPHQMEQDGLEYRHGHSSVLSSCSWDANCHLQQEPIVTWVGWQADCEEGRCFMGTVQQQWHEGLWWCVCTKVTPPRIRNVFNIQMMCTCMCMHTDDHVSIQFIIHHYFALNIIYLKKSLRFETSLCDTLRGCHRVTVTPRTTHTVLDKSIQRRYQGCCLLIGCPREQLVNCTAQGHNPYPDLALVLPATLSCCVLLLL